MPDRDVVKFVRGRNDLQQTAQFRRRSQRHAENFDRLVVDVVVRGDHAKVQRRNVHLVLDEDAFALLQVGQRGLHELGKVVRQVAVRSALQIIIVRILRHAPVEERPREVIDRVLLVLDRLRDDLGVEVVVQEVVEVRLHGKRLVQKLSVKVLPDRLAHDRALARFVVARARRASEHLEDVGYRVVQVTVFLSFEKLRAHDDDHVGRQRDGPAGVAVHDHDRNRAGVVELLDDGLVRAGKRLVVEPDTLRQTLGERLVLRLCGVFGDRVGGTPPEPIRLFVRCGVGKEIHRRQAALLAARHEHDHRLVRRVDRDRRVRRLGHRDHEGRLVRDVVALDMDFQGDRAYHRVEVERVLLRCADPFANVPRRRGKRDDAYLVLRLRRDVAHPRHNDFVRRPYLAADEVELVGNEETDGLHVLPHLPAPRNDVPLLRRRDYHVGLLEQLQICRRLSGQQDDLLSSADLRKLILPVTQSLVRHLLERSDVHAPARTLSKRGLGPQPQQRKLGANCLSGGRGRADKHVVVRVEKGRENLRLDRVERVDPASVHALKLLVAQRGDRQRLQIEDLGVRGILFRKNEVLERDRQPRFGSHPPVANNADKIIRRNGIEHGHREGDRVLLFGVTLLEDKNVVIKNLLSVHVFHEHPESLRRSVDLENGYDRNVWAYLFKRYSYSVMMVSAAPTYLFVPLEIRRYREVNPEHASSDGLHVRHEVKLREHVDVLVQQAAGFGNADELADLLRVEVKQPLPGVLLPLEAADKVGRKGPELAQRGHGRPHAPLHHLAHVQGPAGKLRPAAFQADLKHGAQNASGRLCHVYHVRHQGEPFKLEVRDVRLQQHVYFRRRLLHRLFNRDGHALQQLGQFQLLLFSDRNVLELVRQRKNAEQLDEAHVRTKVLVVGGH
ncbi:MAG: LOW QUALITY PROTEIN: hypothetical protein BJ554DRAFT_4068 [Olpidium bornovanus]|uniref:Uncharacterized protein n=1 Tax=Olpidium bornovanus TaxID=278681 RepID=A0A8H8A0F6_9FUNG|nr:MAG: LOW QUALITY PROTEIN: hypothetical protein BJ554DRAFT_4068 [Olpidium bornovanus]